MKMPCLALALWSFAAPSNAQPVPDRFLLANPDLAEDARIMHFDVAVSGARIVALDEVPAGWTIAITNDPSWHTSVTGQAIVGAAAMTPSRLRRLIAVEAAPGSVAVDVGAPVVTSGSATLMRDGKLRMLRLPRLSLESTGRER